MRNKVLAAAFFAAIGATTAVAGTATISQSGQSLQVSATIVPSCSLQGGSTLAFGNVTTSDLSGGKTVAGTINVTCDAGIDYAIGLGAGQNNNGGRRMSGSSFVGGVQQTFYLPYEIYADAGHTTLVSDIVLGTSTTGSATASTPGGTGTGNPIGFNVYGYIAAGTPKPWPTNYSDNVTITVGY